MDIYRLDEVWSTPGEVIDRLVEERGKLLEQLERFECREYYSRLEDDPEECARCFDNMIGVLREAVSLWNTRQAERKQDAPDKTVCMPLEVDEDFEDVNVRIHAVAVYL